MDVRPCVVAGGALGCALRGSRAGVFACRAAQGILARWLQDTPFPSVFAASPEATAAAAIPVHAPSHTDAHIHTENRSRAAPRCVRCLGDRDHYFIQSKRPACTAACLHARLRPRSTTFFSFFFFRSCEVEKLGALGGVWWTHDLNMEARPAWSPSPRGSFPPLSPLPAAATLPADRVPLNKLPRGAQPSPTVCDGRTRRDLFCMRWTSRRRHAPWT